MGFLKKFVPKKIKQKIKKVWGKRRIYGNVFFKQSIFLL
jgi:hypothetical protein